MMISGFDVGELSEDGPDDLDGLDASAAHIANLLSTEPADGKSFPSYTMKILCKLPQIFVKQFQKLF